MTNQLKPVNNHLLIEPVKHEAFMAAQHDTYQEIGVVVAMPEEFRIKVPVPGAGGFVHAIPLNIGDKVYFDSWLAKKYPKPDTTDEFLWLVKWEDVSMVEYAE